MKKIICTLLIIALLVPSLTIDGVFGNNISSEVWTRYQHNRVRYESIKDIIPHIPEKNVKGHPLNATIFIDKGILVYGNWSSVGKKNDFKFHSQYPTENPKGKPYYELNGKTGEYRYHGFDMEGNLYTNIDFPKDVDLGKSGAEKNWIYRPFTEHKGRAPLASNSTYSKWALGDNDNPKVIINTRQWINRMVRFPINSLDHSSKEPYDYIHVLSPSGIRTVGEGRMWHVDANNRRWYQTFSIPRQEAIDKEVLPTIAEIKITTQSSAFKLNHGQKEVEIELSITGTYQDGEHWKTQEGRTAYYTGYDIDKWSITLTTTGIPVQTVEVPKASRNTGTSKFKVTISREQLEANPNLLFTATATAIFGNKHSSGTDKKQKEIVINVEESKALKSLFTINNYINLINGSNFQSNMLNYSDASIGDIVKYDYFIQHYQKGQKVYSFEVSKVDPKKVNEALGDYIKSEIQNETNGEFHFEIKQTVTDKKGNKDTYAQKLIVDIKPPEVRPYSKNPKIEVDIPEKWFDIVPLPATDYSENVDSRTVFIDGKVVDGDLFFSGNYVFGEDEIDRLLPIEVVYESKEFKQPYNGIMPEFKIIKWIYVYSTKPRAEYKTDGTYKENRKLTVTDRSNNVNPEFVLNHYPINNYQWRFKSNGGDINSLRIRDISDLYKEFMFKEEGAYTIELVVTNTLGRTSDPYEVDIWVMEDYEPAVILNIWNNAMARNEEMNIFHDAVSTDGDIISKNIIELYYDDNNDGNASKLMGTYSTDEFNGYIPTKLGTYKVLNIVEEAFGESTLEEYITEEDRVNKVVEREFFVDNFVPLTELYIDIPIHLPEIDVFFMMDKNLHRDKTDYVRSNRMDINNYLRTKNIRPKVENWDMHTYEYMQPASTTRYTGGTYPSAITNFSSGGYTGTLNRISVSNRPYTVDQGYYTTVYETITRTERYFTTTDGDWPGVPWRWADTAGGLYDYEKNIWVYYTTYWYYDEIITEEVERQVWIHNWVTYNDYVGYYSGTIYKNVRQPYVNPFRVLSDKYIIYVSDGNISELEDLQMVLSKADVKLILIGENNIKNQIPHEHFILNSGPIEEMVHMALEYITESNPYVAKYYVVAGEEDFEISYANYDEEGDQIIEEGFQYVQDQYYFDTPLGMETYAQEDYIEDYWISTLPTKFSKTGKFDIFRRIKDQPTDDTNFDNFSYFSNVPQITVYSHRRPIALAELDWDYDISRNVYLTKWVDKSFDWDHISRREDKGIIDRKISYRRDDGEWIYKVPEELPPGKYELEYYVKDVENTWSDVFRLDFTLSNTPPLQFDAKVRPLDDKFQISGVPASEDLEVFEAWTRFPYAVRLEMALYDGETRKTPIKTVNYSATTAIKTGNDIYWNSISYQIPETLPDGNYILKVSAIGEGGEVKHKNFPIGVKTPINLRVDHLPQFIAGSTIDLQGSTTKYPHEVVAKLYYQTPQQKAVDMNATLVGDNKNWIVEHNVEEELMDGFYKVEFTARTPNGNEERLILDYELLNLRLENLRIVTITDFNWKNYFTTSGGRPTKLTLEGISVKDMPVHVNKQHQGIKLGYKVKFKIDSVGLHQQGDEISIKANYFALDRKNDLFDADIYVEDEKGNYTKIQNSQYAKVGGNIVLNNSHRKTYDKQNKDKYNTWEFEIYIPYSAKIIKEGEKLNLFKNNSFDHKLLMSLDIVGKKKNGNLYDYTLREPQWGTDGGGVYGKNLPTKANLLNKGINHGEVFWYDLKNTALDDLKLERGW